MSVAAAANLMTTEQLLALPDDGVKRWLIEGQLRENGMTVGNRFHSRLIARIAKFLDNWLDGQAEPRGSVLRGEVGVRIQRDPDSTVGVDVVYISSATATSQSDDSTLIEGVPILAVEILSPSDKIENISEKIDGYLSAGFLLVWIVDPHFRTVQILRPDGAPILANDRQELTGDPHLPGFRVAVAKLFQ